MIPPRLVAKHSADCSSAPFAMFPFGRERENINASTGLPYFDDSVVGCKITGFTSNDGSHDIIKLVDSRDDIKHEIWAGEPNADGAGFFNLKSVTAATIVGQSISGARFGWAWAEGVVHPLERLLGGRAREQRRERARRLLAARGT